MAKMLNDTFRFRINRLHAPEPFDIEIQITPDGWLTVWSGTETIWRERVDGPTSNFGVESCDAISRILTCIRNKDDSWRTRYRYIENS